jgi:hypothetical protein
MIGVSEVQCEVENLGVCPLEHRRGCGESGLRDEHMVADSGVRETPLERANTHADEIGGQPDIRIVSAG